MPTKINCNGEAAGLALGVAGLAGLFSSCMGCYQLVQRGVRLHKDYKILETKACGLALGDDRRFDDPGLRASITATLECIRDLFKDEAGLRKKYGIKPATQIASSSMGMGSFRSVHSFRSGSTSRRSLLFWKRDNDDSSTGIRRAAAWAISDRAKFAELVRHLKDFNDDLDDLTKSFTDIVAKQKQIVEWEISEIDDLETLEEIAQASKDDEDLISDTVSVRISSIKSRNSVRAATVTGSGSRRTRSFKTAFTSIPFTIDEAIEMCVVVGDQESGKTRLLLAYTKGCTSGPYTPVVFEDCQWECRVDDHAVKMSLWDTSGQEDYDQLLPMTLAQAYIVILCFRANNPTAQTKENILRIWRPRIWKQCPGVPIVLVGLNQPADELAENDGQNGQLETWLEAVDDDPFIHLSITEEIGASRYFFCDPDTGFGVNDMFNFVS
ncbi:prion-inhibition and propagation-domain-containing protein [Podospora fimiseda]|uniref:Prion-inhibition and propagation-domain-containing protein n=1 Tax=Podospora fimiseda TaxID=252190 RepID=A0AAN7BMA4_9PEZI|nr:prion-inhibition and propagation-domain-containing protein [Podospora fimiseda]